jgi:hypothetical protein
MIDVNFHTRCIDTRCIDTRCIDTRCIDEADAPNAAIAPRSLATAYSLQPTAWSR